jgi:hypothetical protein
LSKGLNFCPTPGEPNFGDLHRDLDKFHISLRRRAFFSQEDPHSDPPYPRVRNDLEQKFKLPSKWNPLGPPDLEHFININEFHFDRIPIHSPRTDNLTRAERQALSELKNMPQIVIKPADKGSAIVIMNKTDYITEAERQLNNHTHYRAVPQDLTHKHESEVRTFLNTMLDRCEITSKMFEYLAPSNSRTPQLYLLPKIHKGTLPPPGRPIMSANGCPTERISQFVDHFLQPLVKETESYIKDTTHFLQKITTLGTLPPGTLLVTLDVTSLYTNIPIDEGKRAVARHLIRHNPGNPPPDRPTNQSIITLLDMTLNKNNFQFYNKNFLQISGTAMGTKCAPSFANLFMADFEERHVYTHTIQPLFWGRFIDDIIALFTHTRDEVQAFVQDLNSCHPTIKFTAEISDTTVTFLDTKIHLDQEGHLSTDLHVKPTDAHNYLLFTSAHIPSCKNGIPYGQFLRVRRICTRREDFEKHSLILAKHFLRRGYPKSLIESSLIRASRQDRQSLLSPANPGGTQDNEEHPPFFFVTTYNPALPNTGNIIKTNKEILARHRTTLPLYETPITMGFRRVSNLRDMLIRAKLSQDNGPRTQSPTPTHACLSPRTCRYCPKLVTTGHITSKATGRSYKTKTKVTCRSNNVIYCIKCTRCLLQYVGETKRNVMERFQEHFYHITKSHHTDTIGHHFNSHGHKGLEDISIKRSLLGYTYYAPCLPWV